MYNKLFTKILDSSIWLEADHTRLVWITFLAVMDQDGVVALSGIGNVANRARVTEEQATAAITCLESPDHKNPDQDNEGRRIERIPGVGWFVLNSEKYRDIVRAEDVRAANRERKRRSRALRHADVTPGHENVTPSDSDTDTNTKADKKKREDAAVPLAVFLGMVESGLSERLGITTLPNQRVWHQKLTWAFQNNFTAAAVLECYDLLKAQEFWQTRSISAKTLIENLAHLPALRAGSGKGRTIETIPTADQIRADEQANDAARRPPPKPITLENVQ